LAAIVRRMMAKSPEQRYQTPAAVALALKPFCRADRFMLPCLNREFRQRLGLEPSGMTEDTPLPDSLADPLVSDSTFTPRAKGDTRPTSSDTLHKWEEGDLDNS
jgi:hypothetical protein